MKVLARTLAAVTVVLGLPLLVAPSSATGAAVNAAQLPARWVHRADVDGDSNRDRLVLRPGADLRVHDGWGTGHYWVRARLDAATIVRRRMWLSYYYPPGEGRWTPWFGAAQLDRRPGRELVLGRTSGAHTSVFTAVTFRNGGLHVLRAPDAWNHAGAGWLVNSSYGTGMQGWQCTDQGVRSRSAEPDGPHRTFRVVTKDFAWHGGWQLLASHRREVPTGPHRQAPRHLAAFASFDCPGLSDGLP
jgi:hypothetical protein